MDISIIVPIYKGKRFVKKIINMFDENMAFLKEHKIILGVELILINDYPEEKIYLDIVRPDVHIYNKTKNEGIHSSRIDGIKLARGSYILLLDQDDEISKDFLYYAYTYRGNSDVVVFNGYKELDSYSKEKIYKTESDIKRLLHKKSFFVSYCQIESPGQCLIKKDSIPKEWIDNVMKNNCADDLFLWILMISREAMFTFVNKYCYIHKYTGTNLSLDAKNKYNSNVEMVSYLENINYVDNKNIELLKIRRRIGGKHPSIIDRNSYIYGYYVCLYGLYNWIYRKKL